MKRRKEESVESEDDDMFSDTFTDKKVRPNNSMAVEVKDNVAVELFDDHEGYYRVNAGDILDGRYRVTTFLGKGVFSTVSRAEDLKNKNSNGTAKDEGDTGAMVAIKILRNNSVMHKAGLKEVAILEKLHGLEAHGNKNIIKFMDSFEYRNHLCLVFENMSSNMRQVLDQLGNKGLNIKAVRVFTRQLFSALKVLREARVIHADIKPDNILINEARNVVKLADFGSASDVRENEITSYLVSRYYRAPEIILGVNYSYPLDTWSMACTLFELFMGIFAFQGKSNNQMLKLMMEMKGRFPLKMLRKGAFTGQHFDLDSNESRVLFLDRHPDGQETLKKFVPAMKPSNDLKQIILSAEEREKISSSRNPEELLKMVTNFVDFLEKCFHLNPDKRLTPQEALMHPFVK